MRGFPEEKGRESSALADDEAEPDGSSPPEVAMAGAAAAAAAARGRENLSLPFPREALPPREESRVVLCRVNFIKSRFMVKYIKPTSV